VVSIWQLFQAREHDRTSARGQVQLLVDGTANRLQASLKDYAGTLSLIASQPLVKAMDVGRCDPLIDGFVRLHPEFVTIGTRHLQGQAICTYLKNPPGTEQLRNFAWFAPAVAAGKFHVSDVFKAPLAGRWVTVLTQPIRDAAQTQQGMVILPLDLQAFRDQSLKDVPDNVMTLVLDRQHRILMHSSGANIAVADPVSSVFPGWSAREMHQPSGILTLTSSAGVPQLAAYRQLTTSGWTVVSVMPQTAVFAVADQSLMRSALISFVLLCFALVLAWWLARGIVRPLEAMVVTTSRIAAGDVDARMVVHQGTPEIVALERAFDHMVKARDQVERALRENERNLAITLQSIGDAVIATDIDGRITRMNPAAERLTGWTLAQALGRPLVEVFRIVHSVTREIPVNPVARVLGHGQVVGLANHTALIARDGSEFQIYDSAAPIRDASDRMVGVVLVFSDVTEQYRLRQVLVESEERYRALVQSSPVGVVVHRDENLVFVNPAAMRMLGADNEAQLLGRNIRDFVHSRLHELIDARLADLKAEKTTFPAQDWRYLRLDGQTVDVQAQASVIKLDGQSVVQVSFMDITERKRAQEQLRENEARFRALTSLSSDWYWEQDEDFRFIQVRSDGIEWSLTNDRPFIRLEYLGKQRWELGETQLTMAQWDQHRAVLLAHQEFRDFEVRFTRPDGQLTWAAISGMPVFGEDGKFQGYRGVGRSITEYKLAQEQINALAFYDALTELPNRRLLLEQLKRALLSHARDQRHGALLFIDLDNFKTLNDTLGHETGDLLLQQVAQRLLACVREADSVARLGGDEFVVMLQGLSADALDAASDAEQVGHKILDAFGPPFVLTGREYRSTPSIGITLFSQGAQGVEDLLKQADLAMYQAKAAGRNTLRMFDQGMQAAVDARVAMETDLRTALAQSQFVLHYQPVVGRTGMVNGAEALVRWQHPTRGQVSPGQFIPLAEATGLIVPLGQWVLDAACCQLAEWGDFGRTRHLTLAVNVSTPQFEAPDFVAQVFEALERHGADPARLKLELTESLLAGNVEDVVQKMAALRERGVDFSLDDFGTGYSSLSYLKRLPLSHLKIDQSFVRDLLVDPNDEAIARTIIALGASLGLAVIAEGVETEGQLALLRAMGCETFQGYLFARPMPIEDFAALLPGPLPSAGETPSSEH
jgi:diguanylate cyclase (GGDEF)-like protein/PAS domain S-box-containing protein